MHDPLLDQRLEHCRHLLKGWQRFHLFLGECAKHDRLFSAQEESQFLKLKSQIAILFDSFFESLDDPNRETIAVAQSIITVVENCILLRQVQKMSTPERKKMELEWHEAYLLINATIGNLEEEQSKLAKISPSKHRQEVILHRTLITIKSIAKDKRVHNGLIAIAVIAVLIVAPKMGLYNYDFLKKVEVTKKAYNVAKSVLRATVMKDLPFDDWEEYAALNHPNEGPAGWNPKSDPETDVNKQLRPLVKMLTDNTPGSDSNNYFAKRTQIFTSGGRETSMVFLLLKKTAYARAVKEQDSKLVEKGLSPSLREKLHVAAYANAVIIVSAPDNQLMQDFRDYCVPPFKKEVKK